MANNLPFQQPIDLITEREMVYDIFERSKLGHDLKDLDNTYFKAGTFLTDLIKKFIYMLPHTLVLNFLNVKVGEIKNIKVSSPFHKKEKNFGLNKIKEMY